MYSEHTGSRISETCTEAHVADWPFSPPITPMEAEVADELPPPPGWSYEPKWDGFRAVMWSTGGGAGETPRGPRLDSRNGKALLRYFPELEPALTQLPAGTVADGEVVVIIDGRLDFDALQNRIHPAASRIRRLAEETPAHLALFDLLAYAGRDLRALPHRERREALEELAASLGVFTAGDPGRGDLHPRDLGPACPWLLSPSTTDVDLALRWFHDFEAAGFDGVVAKALERPYAEGRREMIKLKHRRTADCIVGGYRVHKDGRRVGSILLGLYDARGELHFIGHCSSFTQREAEDLLRTLRDLEAAAGTASGGVAATAEASSGGSTMPEIAPAGFGAHARRPGEPSRWSGDKDLAFVAIPPVLVVEVSYDQLTGDRFRHGTRFERWRPDKDPRDCTLDQLERPKGPALLEALKAGLSGWPVGGSPSDPRGIPRESRDAGPGRS